MSSKFISVKPPIELAVNNFRSVLRKPNVFIVFWIRGGRHIAINRVLGVDKEKRRLYSR